MTMSRPIAPLSAASLPATSLLAALLLAACSASAPDDGQGGLAPGEAEKLHQAAERLDARDAPPARAASERLEADVRAGIAAERPPAGQK